MWEPESQSALAQAILISTKGYLGGEANLARITTQLFPAQTKATVWVELRSNTPSVQLAAVESFFDVQDCYADELEVELRFGTPSDDAVAAEALVENLVLTR